MEVVAFFDIAPHRIGYCVGAGDTVPTADFISYDFPPEDLGGLGAAFWEHLDLLHARFGFTVAAYEKPILVVGFTDKNGNRRTDKLVDLRRTYGLGFLLETWCAMNGIPCGEETLQAVKKEATRNANATKEEVSAQIEKIGIQLPKGPGRFDAADAAAGWLIGIRVWNNHLSASWDKKLFSAKGVLI